MKKLLSLLFLIPALVFGAAGDIKIGYKSSNNVSWIDAIFATQNGVLLGLNASGVPYVATSGKLNLNALALPTPLTGTMLQLGQVDGTQTRITLDSFGTNSSLDMRRANGTNASKTAVLSGNILGAFSAAGYGTSAYSSGRASVNLYATENWTDSANGTGIQFRTTPTGATSSTISGVIIPNYGFAGPNNILYYGADPTGSTSCTSALNAALTYLNTSPRSGGILYFPQGTYLFSTKPNAVDGGITIQGEGIGRTILVRNYSEGSAHLGFIDMTCGSGRNNGGGGLRELTVYAATGTTGGAAIGAESSASVGQGLLYFTNVNVTGLGTWNYPMYFDGTAKTTAAIGLRIVSIVGCSLFQADIEGLYAKGVVHFNVVNTGVYATGGNASAGFTLDGTTAVPSSNVQAFFEFCSSMNLAATSSNSVSEVILSSTNATSLTVTSNLSSAVYLGRYGSLSGTCDGLSIIGPTATVLASQTSYRQATGNSMLFEPTDAYSVAQAMSLTLYPKYNAAGTRLGVSSVKLSRTSTADGQYASQIELITRAAAGSLTTGLTVKSSSIINHSTTPDYADNAAALAGGLVAGDIYRTTDTLKIVH